MSIFYRFNKPEYIFKPSQLLKRCFHIGTSLDHSKMPWGETLYYNPVDDIGKAINILGVYELPLTELIYRSLLHVDHFLDIGSNIGYYSSLAASLSNIKSVHAFEPHPKILENLKKNTLFSSKVVIHEYAASDREGKTSLYIPKDFESNMGIATLERDDSSQNEEIPITMKTLDSVIDVNKKYCVKIDTEGHEASVLNGAKELLKSGSLRCIFFEEFQEYPHAETFQILEKFQYSIFRIERSLTGPKLENPNKKNKSKRWQPINFLAVKNSDQILFKLRESGWRILKL